MDRRDLTFSQAEAIDELPRQLALKEVSRELRAQFWALFYKWLQRATKASTVGGVWPWIDGSWEVILRDKHVYLDHEFVGAFDHTARILIPKVGAIFKNGDYGIVFSFIQFVCRHPNCPFGFEPAIESILRNCRSSYRIHDGTVYPIVGDEDGAVVTKAFDALRGSNFPGAREHLRQAASELTAGDWGSSVRESVSAVESVVRMLTDANSVSDALKRLNAQKAIHPVLRQAFEKMYAYSSDAQGVRHALLEQEAPDVDEADALFMFGACASFVTYLLEKGRLTALVA